MRRRLRWGILACLLLVVVAATAWSTLGCSSGGPSVQSIGELWCPTSGDWMVAPGLYKVSNWNEEALSFDFTLFSGDGGTFLVGNETITLCPNERKTISYQADHDTSLVVAKEAQDMIQSELLVKIKAVP